MKCAVTRAPCCAVNPIAPKSSKGVHRTFGGRAISFLSRLFLGREGLPATRPCFRGVGGSGPRGRQVCREVCVSSALLHRRIGLEIRPGDRLSGKKEGGKPVPICFPGTDPRLVLPRPDMQRRAGRRQGSGRHRCFGDAGALPVGPCRHAGNHFHAAPVGIFARDLDRLGQQAGFKRDRFEAEIDERLV